MPFFQRLANGIDNFNERLGRILFWLTLVMVLVSSYNAIVRYLVQFASLEPTTPDSFGTTLISYGQEALRAIGQMAVALNSNGFLELQWYLFSVVFLLGAAYTLKHNAHVRVDVLYSRLSVKGKAWINLLGTILFLLPFCLLMLWVSWPSVENSWAVREMSPDPGGLPRYPIRTLIPVAFALLLLQGTAMLIRQVAILRGVFPNGEQDMEDLGHGL